MGLFSKSRPSTHVSEDPSAEYAIQVDHLTREFGSVKAIDDLSFEVRKGEVLGFLGPNGAGKSTTLRILAGLLPATTGCARILGFSVAEAHPDMKKQLGYMPEMNPLPEEMRVEEYLRFRANIKEIPKNKRKACIEMAMETCELQHNARKKIIGTLSKGFRQRVGIADAVLAAPKIVLMDEPTIGLDPHQVLGIRQLIDDMRGRMTVVLSSHILSEIEKSCDRVLIINNGKRVAQGTSEELRREFLPHQTLIVELQKEPDSFQNILAQLHSKAVLKSSMPSADGFFRYEVEFEGDPPDVTRLVNHLVKDYQIPLKSILPEKPGLEDVFLAATKKAWKVDIPESHIKIPTKEHSEEKS